MKKVKITVLKRMFIEDLYEEYAAPGLELCELHEEGQVFYCKNGWRKPEGLCDNAWKSMLEYVMSLSAGGKNFYNGKWINDPEVVIISCNDGLRPVFFKVELAE